MDRRTLLHGLPLAVTLPATVTRLLGGAAILAPVAATASAASAAAADAPGNWQAGRPVRIIVPYPPGGSADLLARALADRLQPLLGAPCIVDNRPGGAAVVGTEAAAQAAPDGHTLVLGTNQTHAANASMLRHLSYRPVEDFAPIGRLAEVHHALVVPAAGPATIAALVAEGKKQPLNYASSGVGSASHVLAAAFCKDEGLEGTHVPYRGGAQATTDTVGGVVDFLIATWPSVEGLVRDGKLRCLAIGAPSRLPGFPMVPTFAESGLPQLAVDAWFGLWAPAATPPAIVTEISDAVVKALAEPALVQVLDQAGFIAAPMPAGPFAAFQKAEVERWRHLVALTGIQLDQ